MKISLRWLKTRLAFRLGLLVVILLIVEGVVYEFRYDIRHALDSLTAPDLAVTRRTNLYPIDIKTIPVVLDDGQGGGLAMAGGSLKIWPERGAMAGRQAPEN